MLSSNFNFNINYLLHHLRTNPTLLQTTSVHSLLLKSSLLISTPSTLTILLLAYLRVSQPGPALRLLQSSLNPFSLSAAISRLPFPSLHALALSSGHLPDLFVSASVVSLYSRLNLPLLALRAFREYPSSPNLVLWGSAVSALATNAYPNLAFEVFGEFIRESGFVRPNHFLLSAFVSACASSARLAPGRCAHTAVVRLGYGGNEVIAGALVDMYAKCGCVRVAKKVFDGIEGPTVVPCTAMIAAAGKYGDVGLAVEVFDEMSSRGVSPNEVTFLGLLHACSHSGSVEVGIRYFEEMEGRYGVVPGVRHYTCAVDMLGRVGKLDEAYELSKKVKVGGEDALMLWTTLLSASRKHGRMDVAAEARKRLAEFDGHVAGAYVVMSNAYASAGNWEGAVGVRSEMRRRGIRKDPGCSWIEIRDVAYVFYSGNVDSCGRGSEVLEFLRDLEVRMRERGYVGGGSEVVSHGLEEETKDMMIGMHSERLALAFGLISTPKSMVLRVMKNLRICWDCHEAFKITSGIMERSFVVRDLNRFHHFSNGSCSCGDYW